MLCGESLAKAKVSNIHCLHHPCRVGHSLHHKDRHADQVYFALWENSCWLFLVTLLSFLMWTQSPSRLASQFSQTLGWLWLAGLSPDFPFYFFLEGRPLSPVIRDLSWLPLPSSNETMWPHSDIGHHPNTLRCILSGPIGSYVCRLPLCLPSSCSVGSASLP